MGIVFKGSPASTAPTAAPVTGRAPKEKVADVSWPSADAKTDSGSKTDSAKSDTKAAAKDSSSKSPVAKASGSSGSAGEKVA